MLGARTLKPKWPHRRLAGPGSHMALLIGGRVTSGVL